MSGSELVWCVHGAVVLAMVALSGRELRRLAKWDRGAWEQLPVAQGTSPSVSAGADLRLADGDGPELLVAELLTELERTPAPNHRVALLNEATSEFESRIGFGRMGWLGWRVCLASGVGWACLTVMQDVAIAASYLGSGAVGGLLTWNLGRVADSRVRRLRERWNGLIRRLSRSFPQTETFGDRPLTMQCEADEHG